ncbi:Sacs [Symbiodinium sp. CCMP2592]|nr:Sacs [Symbiodinium sp. CCMP2592]
MFAPYGGGPAPFPQGAPFPSSGPSGSSGGGRPPALGTVLTGTVKSYSAKGFGFILCPDVDHDVYFARESLQDGLRTANIAGTVVQFVLQRGLHGKPQATCLRPLDGQIAPMAYNRGYTPEPGQGWNKGGSSSFAGKGAPAFGAPAAPAFAQQFTPQLQVPAAGSWPNVAGVAGVASLGQGCMGATNMGSGASNMGSGLAGGVGVMGGMSLTGLSVPSSLGSPRPPVAPKRLSPHAGSRAMAGLPAKAAEQPSGSPSGKSSSASSEPESSDSSSSEKKRRKKKDKKKKGKKERSRSRRRKSKSSKKSRLSVSSSSGKEQKEEPSSEVQQAIESAKREVLQQLENLKKVEPKEQRMKEWRSLLRSWHPDKNPEKAEVATQVFQFLQKGKLLLGL